MQLVGGFRELTGYFILLLATLHSHYQLVKYHFKMNFSKFWFIISTDPEDKGGTTLYCSQRQRTQTRHWHWFIDLQTRQSWESESSQFIVSLNVRRKQFFVWCCTCFIHLHTGSTLHNINNLLNIHIYIFTNLHTILLFGHDVQGSQEKLQFISWWRPLLEPIFAENAEHYLKFITFNVATKLSLLEKA